MGGNTVLLQVELVTTRLDFGLFRLGSSKTRILRLKNASATCGASWALEEVVTKEGSAISQTVRHAIAAHWMLPQAG